MRAALATAPLQRGYEAAWHTRFDRRVMLCQFVHHVLVRPGVVDLVIVFKSLARRLLTARFALTRDRCRGWNAD